MKREHWLIVYSIGVGLVGWVLLAWQFTPPAIPLWHVAVFILTTLLIESVGFRVPPADPHTLAGVAILSITLAVGPSTGALVVAINAFLIGMVLPFVDQRPATFYSVVVRPWTRAGVRVLAVYTGVWLASHIAGPVGIALQIASYPACIMLNRWVRIGLDHGAAAVRKWWQSVVVSVVIAEVIPLPLAILGAHIYTDLGIVDFILGGFAVLGASAVMRQVTISLRQQRAATNELTILNATSRAIIRAELDVDSLCDLIYHEAGNVLDTSSFHLGIFEPDSDRYTLKVRVQDNQRLPALTVDLPSGDGLIGWMRQTGRSLLITDFVAEMDRLPARPRYQSSNPPRSGIYVPLISGDQVIGSISVQSLRVNAFQAEDLRRLSQIADQAAVAITKARTFHEARERAVQLQAIQDVSAHLSVLLEPDELLPEVLRLIREHFGYHPVHCITVADDGTLQFRATTTDHDAAEFMRDLVAGSGTGIIAHVARTGQTLLVNDVRNDIHYVEDDPHTRSELAVPIRFGERLIGVLDVQSSEVWRFHQTDVFVMQTLADQIALALERARAFSAQREEAWRLNVLLQAAEELSRPTALGDLLTTAVRLPLRLLDCRRCVYLAWDRHKGSYIAAAAAGLTPLEEDELIGVQFAESFFKVPHHPAHNVMLSELPLGHDAAMQPFHGRHVLILIARGRSSTPGILVADYDIPERTFGEREQKLFSGLAGQIGSAIENALLEQEAANAARLEEELRVARDIQTSLLPARAPILPGWDITAHWRAARVIGGDFYDYWPLRDADNQPLFGFVIADVSDKGMAAALFMALSRSLVRAAALDGSDPALALMRANRWITRDSESGMFVTIFYGILNPATGHLRYCCAGHNPPILLRPDGSFSELSTPGIALGVIEEATLHSRDITMDAGDLLVCYTDGVTESFDDHDNQYGTQRLRDMMHQHRHDPTDVTIQAIADDVTTFSEGRIYDDVTMFLVKRKIPKNTVETP